MIKIFILVKIFLLISLHAGTTYTSSYNHDKIELKSSKYDKIFIREYTYISTPSDTRLSSKIKAISWLKSLLAEEVGTVIESNINISNSNGNEYIKSEINSLSVNITKLKILHEKWNGKSYYIKAKVKINEKRTLQLLADVVKASGKQKEIDQLNMLLKENGFKIDSLNKTVNKLNNKLDNSIPMVKIIDNSEAGYFDLTKTYGFYKGQSYMLKLIMDEYPELKNEVNIANHTFRASFSSSLKSIRSILEKNQKLFKDTNFQLLEIYKNMKVYSKSKAIEFINIVKKRAKGELESPIIENLLIYNPIYNKNPRKELEDGFKKFYFSKGSPKAKGVSFEVSVPQSWKSEEARRPNIVRKFISKNGFGEVFIMIIIKKIPIPDDMILSNKDIKDYLITDDIIKTVDSGVLLNDYGRFSLENIPGFWQEVEMPVSRGEHTLDTKSKHYIFYYQNRMIMIQLMTADMKNKKYLETFNQYEPILKWVVNSFVLPDMYK